MNILSVVLSISGGGNKLKRKLTIRYLLAIAILLIPFQGSMAAGCELPSEDIQTIAIDHSAEHTQSPADTMLEQHSCCDEATCPEMDSYCGSCMNLVSLTNEIAIFTSSMVPEFHINTATFFSDLPPPPPTKPPV